MRSVCGMCVCMSVHRSKTFYLPYWCSRISSSLNHPMNYWKRRRKKTVFEKEKKKKFLETFTGVVQFYQYFNLSCICLIYRLQSTMLHSINTPSLPVFGFTPGPLCCYAYDPFLDVCIPKIDNEETHLSLCYILHFPSSLDAQG